MHSAERPVHNRILSALSEAECRAITQQAEFVSLPAGHIMYRAGDPVTTAYFPYTGTAVAFAALPSGEYVATMAVGADGVLGIGPLIGVETAVHDVRIQVASTGYLLTTATLHQVFEESAPCRRVILKSIGHQLQQIARSALCNRFHSQRQRVARWLVVLTAKTGHMSVPLTHDVLAQLVGGPRHAVSEFIAEFRQLGILEPARGSIDLLDRERLSGIACDCYVTDLRPCSAP